MNRSPCVCGNGFPPGVGIKLRPSFPVRAGNGRISGLKKGIHSRVCVGSAISTTVSVLENVSFPCVQPQPVPQIRVKVGLLVVNSAGDGNLRHIPSFSCVWLIGRTFLTYQFPRACVGGSEDERNQIPVAKILPRVCGRTFTVFSVKAPGKPRRRLRRSPVCVGRYIKPHCF